MKRFLIAAILISIISNKCFGQEIDNSNKQLTKADYLKRSKDQKLAAWIFLGTGLASFAIVAPGNTSFETTGLFVIIGGICVVTSIPLFIASGRNKRKAQAISGYLKFERTLSNEVVLNKTIYIPAFALKINL